MHVGVVKFPGGHCDRDVMYALNLLDIPSQWIWHKDTSIGNIDAVVLPGGFTYGDYDAVGQKAADAPIMGAIKSFASKNGPVLGICNGFQILCAAGLLPGKLMRNVQNRFQCADSRCIVERRTTLFTRGIINQKALNIPIAHGFGQYTYSNIDDLEENNQIVFRYDTENVQLSKNNLNSTNNIAGVCNKQGNIVGMMPHPERACEFDRGSQSRDGQSIFLSLLV